jgi:hypothetical protein
MTTTVALRLPDRRLAAQSARREPCGRKPYNRHKYALESQINNRRFQTHTLTTPRRTA